MIHELAILSGKGGTGKTTLALSLIPFIEDLVIADCDVDAPDIHLVLANQTINTIPFYGIQKPFINDNLCTKCGLCAMHCNYGAISDDIIIDLKKCEGCTVCNIVCPVHAISMVDTVIGDLYEKETPYGPMIDARLIPGEEASGKLVAEVRRISREAAKKANKNHILIDGSPGVGCNVMSTITGVNQAILVTEPSESGFHDLKRIIQLAKMVSVDVLVVVNKYNNSIQYTQIIEEYCNNEGIEVALKIPYDKAIFHSINNLESPSLSTHPFFQSDEWKQFLTKIQVVNI